MLAFGHGIVGASIDGFDGIVAGWLHVADSIAGGIPSVEMLERLARYHQINLTILTPHLVMAHDNWRVAKAGGPNTLGLVVEVSLLAEL